MFGTFLFNGAVIFTPGFLLIFGLTFLCVGLFCWIRRWDEKRTKRIKRVATAARCWGAISLVLAWSVIASVMLVATAATSGSGATDNKKFSWTWETTNDAGSVLDAGSTHGDETGTLKMTVTATSSVYAAETCTSDAKNAAETTNNVVVKNDSDRTLIIGTISAEGGSCSGIETGSKLNPGDTFGIAVTSLPESTTDGTPRTKTVNVSITYTIVKNIDVVYYGANNVSYTYDGTVLDDSTKLVEKEMSAGSSITLPAAPTVTSGTFSGWRLSHDGSLHQPETTVTINESTSVYPVVINDGLVAPFTVGDSSYYYWTDAAYVAANTTKLIILNDDYTLPTTMAANGVPSVGSKFVTGTDGNIQYIVPSGVTLLIPFNDKNTLYTKEPGVVETYTKPTAYRTLTMSEGANIIVNGALSVSGEQSAKFGENGLVTGPVGFINTEAGSSISVENGGALYVWGYITGSGEVVAKNGAYVYEDFQFEDWRGGDQAMKMKNEVFPISQFYIQNIEVPLTLEAGAKEYGYSSIKVTLLGIRKASPYLFGNSDALFEISEGSITKRYDGTKDRLIIDINGSVTLGTLEMKLGTYGIDSENYDLMLNGNISINVHDGADVTISGDIAAIPGVELTVDEGASVTVASGVNLYIYDSDTWGTYCSSSNKTVMPLNYAPGRTYTRTEKDLKDVSILINGEVDASGAFIYTTKGGANIHSEGGGIIKINGAGTQTVTHQVIQAAEPDNSTYVEIPITPAMLKNGNGTFVETSKYGSGTYKYIGGYWHLGEDHTYNWDSVLNDTETKYINHLCCDFCTDLLATVDLQYRLDDYIWMNAVVTLENGVTGEITSDSGIELVDLENGTYYLVRKVVAKELTTDFTAGLAIDGIAKPFTIQLGFAAFDATLPDNHVHKPLVAKMMAYGEAAVIYFDKDLKAAYNKDESKVVPDEITMTEAKDTAMSLTNGAESGVTGASLKTNSAKVYFDEALRMSVFFTPTGFDESKIVKIGLLASPGVLNDTGVLTAANHQTMYVLYSLTSPEIPGGSENNPDEDLKENVNNTVTSYNTLPAKNDSGRWELCFDLTNEMYNEVYELRPFVIVEDETGTHYVYGEQVHYSLAAYISRTYAKSTDKAFKNLLTATWDYIVAADAAF